MPYKILISTSSFNISASESLKKIVKKGFEIVQNSYGRSMTEAEVGDLLKDGVIGMVAGVEPLSRRVLMEAKDLRVISRCGIGMDSVDVAAAEEKKIWIANTPGAPCKAVAELTMGLMLDLLRRISEADRYIRANNWRKLMGSLISEQTVGIVGYGRIGKQVAKLLKAFGAQVLIHDKYATPDDPDIVFCQMDYLVAHADVITLHVPYVPDTHHLFNELKINSMKKGALLINVSRGGLIDERALLTALESGHLAGAALDCFEEEPYQGPLARLDQVILTAHMGSYAKEARVLMEQEAADNLLRGLVEQGCLVLEE